MSIIVVWCFAPLKIQVTDQTVSIVSRVVNSRLQQLRAAQCARLTDDALMALTASCSDLQLLDVSFDFLLTPSALARFHEDMPNVDLVWDSLDRIEPRPQSEAEWMADDHG